ncbi:hypothetical protein HPB49_019177 [Dermacentor silvarum]|uniref:Uncharacterized protein n=1 Tax=Dermacentor silvarum TaxID=543639 RepID=A0ACB8D7U8_DERSI|nr:hypothetical protein HPB49_019177 [Dermacentor silvarum]
MFNLASCIMITPVSYHGGVGHKPVIMGIGALVVSAGSMVFASPHFLAPQYMVVDSGAADVCPQRGPGQCESSASSGVTTSANFFKYFFMAGHALHGVGSSPFFTLGVAYLDQNTPSASASIYMGIFYATSVLGPAMGFLLGGYFLSMYTDITADHSKLGMDSTSNNWVGAWWLGFFGASIVAFFTAFPIASFPRALPTAIERAKDLSRLQKEKRMQSLKQAPSTANAQAAPDAQTTPGSQAVPDVQATTPASQALSDAQATQDTQATPGSQATLDAKGAASAQRAPEPGVTSAPPDMQIASDENTGKEKRSFANHVKRLISNPTFVCLTLAASAETMIASGLTGFATKIFISMFGISSSRASSLLGIVSVPSACGGTLLGGYFITKLNVKSSTIVRYCVVLSFVPWFTIFVFMHSCPSNHRALVNLTSIATNVYGQKLTFGDLEHSCNAHCNCSRIGYDPVCGSDNFTYYSPCIAGCGDVRNFKSTKLYNQCTCVNGPTLFMAAEKKSNETGNYYMAKRDPCTTDCRLILVYAIAIFVALFFTFLLIVPALTALLRSLDEDIKSTGIGVNYVAIRLLGTIPGPILFGHLIDRSCVLWQGTCDGGSGACAVYENSAMGMNLFLIMLGVKSASIVPSCQPTPGVAPLADAAEDDAPCKQQGSGGSLNADTAGKEEAKEEGSDKMKVARSEPRDEAASKEDTVSRD